MMKTKVFVFETNKDIKELQELLDNGWSVEHATPRSKTGAYLGNGQIVYILIKE